MGRSGGLHSFSRVLRPGPVWLPFHFYGRVIGSYWASFFFLWSPTASSYTFAQRAARVASFLSRASLPGWGQPLMYGTASLISSVPRLRPLLFSFYFLFFFRGSPSTNLLSTMIEGVNGGTGTGIAYGASWARFIFLCWWNFRSWVDTITYEDQDLSYWSCVLPVKWFYLRILLAIYRNRRCVRWMYLGSVCKGVRSVI